MMTRNAETSELLERLSCGGQAVAEVEFSKYYERLYAFVALRMDERIRARVDPEDILQEVFLEFSKSLLTYLQNPVSTLYLWTRAITAQHLSVVHRRHLTVQSRAVGRELSLSRAPGFPSTNSTNLASYLVGRLSTPSQKLMRIELQMHVQQALAELTPIDREILALRHFEMLSNHEIASLLDISEAAASNRYFRALKRIKTVLQEMDTDGGLP